MPQPKQDRAIRTRHTILMAAAAVFEERGYQAATISEILSTANVTKGALYFHFTSKEQLAQGVLAAQDQSIAVPDRPCKIQELIDTTMLRAYRLQTDPLVRAAARLILDQRADGLDRTGPFQHWTSVTNELLDKAQKQGELLPHVNPAETARVLVGAFAGVQAMSQATTNYQDLPAGVSALLRHTLPTVVHSSVLASLDLTPQRGHAIHTETTATAAPDAATTEAAAKATAATPTAVN
ncbi:ScbR family autoregulator-binding transcription factor [Streptomyces sp. N50]|uniref:ScbR family autoregulator-binding transcription factor n=1 Tax=Streptomyces sp. N50 TaxID=3081765 RepID=UPI0029625588|nr:ScbR family autoregulator-binding transcription factor [Streptomyces sp. N50]WOX15290.1 ScbR family autoregulator-binding transcription factor [Streptomyces sp. N50]